MSRDDVMGLDKFNLGTIREPDSTCSLSSNEYVLTFKCLLSRFSGL
jgi:hypothetical protein